MWGRTEGGEKGLSIIALYIQKLKFNKRTKRNRNKENVFLHKLYVIAKQCEGFFFMFGKEFTRPFCSQNKIFSQQLHSSNQRKHGVYPPVKAAKCTENVTGKCVREKEEESWLPEALCLPNLWLDEKSPSLTRQHPNYNVGSFPPCCYCQLLPLLITCW